MFTEPTLQAIAKELSQLTQARAAGNEGKARVCARRAAGIAARAYCDILGIPYENPSALSVLKLIQELEILPESTRLYVQHLVAQVDVEHNLPEHIDLEAEAKALVADLQALISGG